VDVGVEEVGAGRKGLPQLLLVLADQPPRSLDRLFHGL
jgi:hypothetical protein